jgi:PAS domain S-box-containing protein
MVHDLTGDRPFLLSNVPAERQDRRLALTVVLFSVVIFIVAAPFARLPLPEASAFIPVYQSALAINDVITAVLLFSQFSLLRSRALLVLSCAYLLTAVMAVLHLLTFPGLFSTTGLLGAGPQTTAWLYMFWHGAFPLAVFAYALLRDRGGAVHSSGRITVVGGIVVVLAISCVLTMLATVGQPLLPPIMQGNNYTPVMIAVVSTVWILSVLALAALSMRRPRTKLDLWLMVVMCAWMFDVALSAVLNAGRFDLGFYAGRLYGLLAASFILVVLLCEMGALYARLARSLETETEERRRVFETSLDLILITDRRGTLIRVSPSSTAILGYRPEEMIGRSAAEFIHADDLEPTRNEMRSARRGHETRNFETRYVHKDGGIVTLAWTGVWSEPEQRHFFIGRDMTESKKAQETLRESEHAARSNADILNKTLASMVEGVMVADENARIVIANPAARKLFPGLPDVGSDAYVKAYDRFLPDGVTPMPPQQMPLYRALQGEAVDDLAMIWRPRGTAQTIHVVGTSRPITDVNGNRKGAVAVFRDVTKGVETERQLSQAQKLQTIGQLTGGIAHDFNNILTVITGTIEILAEAVAKEPKLAAITQMIDEAATRGAELTHRLLAFARRQPLQPRTIDINALILSAANLLRPTLGDHVEIKSELDRDAWHALVDASQLTTALLNLALNARDAMTEGGKLILETGNVYLDETYAKNNSEVQPGPYVMIAVSDTGHGIPAAIRDKVFDPFFTTKETGKGTGLGLSMVYGFVKQSNGHIKVYSEEGHGTTIKVYLPRAGEQVEQATYALPVASVEGGKESVLIVEDDALVLNYVVAQFQSLGYAAHTATNATEGLAIIDRGVGIDLLFTDVMMPGGMNGRQLADTALKRRPSLKVLFTSGYTENAMVHHGRLDPGVLLLPKPYRKSDLARMVRSALDSGAVSQNSTARRASGSAAG